LLAINVYLSKSENDLSLPCKVELCGGVYG
jgi:hypothetical protein